MPRISVREVSMYREWMRESGLLLRGYAGKEAGVRDVVERLSVSFVRAKDLHFGRIVILVPKDKDCGETIPVLRRKILSLTRGETAILNPRGNENSDVLNAGLNYLRKFSCEQAFVVSNKASSYIMGPNTFRMFEAFERSALVAGLAVRDETISEDEDEVYSGVLEGRISNIFACWNLAALEEVGDFDSKIGVEEIAPIIRIIKAYGGWKTAPIIPYGEVGLDISPLRAERWAQISTTKTARQMKEAERAGGSFELIKQGVMPGYPQ